MTENIEQAIVAARRDQQQARDGAEQLLEQVISTTAAYVVELNEYFMDRALRDKAETIEALPQQELSSLKSTYQKTLADLPDLTRQRVLTMDWPHRSEIPESLRSNMMASFDLGRRADEELDQLVRALAGQVGLLLVKSKLADVQPQSEWKTAGKDAVAYAYGLMDMGPTSAQYKQVKDLYQSRLDEYVEASKALYAAEVSKHQATAKSRWEKS